MTAHAGEEHVVAAAQQLLGGLADLMGPLSQPHGVSDMTAESEEEEEGTKPESAAGTA